MFLNGLRIKMPQSEENTCPECGKWKGEDYDVCYECHEAGY